MTQITFPTAPGVAVNVSATTGGSGNPAPNAIAYVVGIADRGPVTPTRVADPLDYASKFGGRSGSAALLYDSVEEIFGEGGFDVYVGRLTGPSPTKGTLALVDRAGSPVLTMTLNAAWYGLQSANITVSITASANGVANTFDVNVFDSTSPTPAQPVEVWRDNATVSAAVAQINAGSVYLTAVDNASGSSGLQAQPAIIAATALSAGTDDRADLVDANWTTAINAFPLNLGPGLILAPGKTTAAVHLAAEAAAASSGRFALLDVADLASASAVSSVCTADVGGSGITATGDSGMVVAPWVQIPPAPGGSINRSVPGSAFVAGLIARTDAQYGHSNQAPIGIFGLAQHAVGLSGPGYTDAERTTINGRQGTTGASVIRSTPDNPVQLYGFRTLSTATAAYFAANIRETLYLRWLLAQAGEKYVGSQIDGRRLLFQNLDNDLSEILLDQYTRNALYGDTAGDAFGVDTGPSVNTPQTVAAGLIKANIWFIPSPTGERVVFNLVKKSVTG